MRKPKRLVIGLTAGALTFGGVFAFAASITVSPSSLGAGSGATSACDSSVGVSFATPVYTNGSGFTTNSVTVTGLDTTACTGRTVSVTVTDASNNALANGSGSVAVPASGTTATVALAGTVAASGVLNAHVSIN